MNFKVRNFVAFERYLAILFVSTGVSIQRSPHLSLKFAWKVASVDIPTIPNYFIYY